MVSTTVLSERRLVNEGETHRFKDESHVSTLNFDDSMIWLARPSSFVQVIAFANQCLFRLCYSSWSTSCSFSGPSTWSLHFVIPSEGNWSPLPGSDETESCRDDTGFLEQQRCGAEVSYLRARHFLIRRVSAWWSETDISLSTLSTAREMSEVYTGQVVGQPGQSSAHQIRILLEWCRYISSCRL